MVLLLKVDQEVKFKVDFFRECIISEVEDLVVNFFLKKLLEFDSFLKELILNIYDLIQIYFDMNFLVFDFIFFINSYDGLDGFIYKK